MRNLLALCLFVSSVAASAQSPTLQPLATAAGERAPSAPAQSELKFVVIVTRHGVRSPTGKLDQLNQYSRQPWPAWSVPPGYLTPHGAQLMKLFGAYDRELLASQGLLAPNGCADAARIRILADSDQRTRETGKALAAGLAPGCNIEVTALPEGTADPLFHSVEAGVGAPDRQLAAAAVSGRVGNNPLALTDAYRLQLEALDDVLNACDPTAACKPKPDLSLFDMPASIAPGKADHLVDLKTPLALASTISENLLLEYAEGMDAAKVGWGGVDLPTLRDLLQLHVGYEDINLRTPYIARAQASNLLDHVLRSLDEAAGGHAVPGALIKPDDKLLILAGHDTNIANMAGALNLNWIIDGRRDDTPPGGALVFELWKQKSGGELSVRLYYSAQTLDQMRNATPLSLMNPPESVPVFIPACSRADGSCDWAGFRRAMTAAIDPSFVK